MPLVQAAPDAGSSEGATRRRRGVSLATRLATAAVGVSFAALAANDPTGFAVIDGNSEPESVHDAIVAAISSLFGGDPSC